MGRQGDSTHRNYCGADCDPVVLRVLDKVQLIEDGAIGTTCVRTGRVVSCIVKCHPKAVGSRVVACGQERLLGVLPRQRQADLGLGDAAVYLSWVEGRLGAADRCKQ